MNPRTITPHELLGPLNELERKNAPTCLFVAGDIGIFETGARVSIIGARKATPEGIRRAARLAALLAERGIVVVSGLAAGIDTAAHTAAIKHRGRTRRTGRTVAVLGTPLDQVYPKQNAALQHEIMTQHLAVSQYPPGSPIERKNFPIRNLTMALLSDATVIIEASDSSGSLYQGREALRLGRHFFIAKSAVEVRGLTWPDEMLSRGARILSDETLDEFFDLLPARPAP
jgi:DNA processing protein